MGADFYTAWALNESLIKPWEREFPLDHLVNIYHITPKSTTNVSAGNFTDVNLAALEECQELFDLGLWALKNLGPLAFPTYNRLENKLPIIAEVRFGFAALTDSTHAYAPVPKCRVFWLFSASRTQLSLHAVRVVFQGLGLQAATHLCHLPSAEPHHPSPCLRSLCSACSRCRSPEWTTWRPRSALRGTASLPGC